MGISFPPAHSPMAPSPLSGTVEWGGWSYNLDEDEIILDIFDVLTFIGDEQYSGTGDIAFYPIDAPSAHKSTTFTIKAIVK